MPLSFLCYNIDGEAVLGLPAYTNASYLAQDVMCNGTEFSADRCPFSPPTPACYEGNHGAGVICREGEYNLCFFLPSLLCYSLLILSDVWDIVILPFTCCTCHFSLSSPPPPRRKCKIQIFCPLFIFSNVCSTTRLLSVIQVLKLIELDASVFSISWYTN